MKRIKRVDLEAGGVINRKTSHLRLLIQGSPAREVASAKAADVESKLKEKVSDVLWFDNLSKAVAKAETYRDLRKVYRVFGSKFRLVNARKAPRYLKEAVHNVGIGYMKNALELWFNRRLEAAGTKTELKKLRRDMILGIRKSVRGVPRYLSRGVYHLRRKFLRKIKSRIDIVNNRAKSNLGEFQRFASQFNISKQRSKQIFRASSNAKKQSLFLKAIAPYLKRKFEQIFYRNVRGKKVFRNVIKENAAMISGLKALRSELNRKFQSHLRTPFINRAFTDIRSAINFSWMDTKWVGMKAGEDRNSLRKRINPMLGRVKKELDPLMRTAIFGVYSHGKLLLTAIITAMSLGAVKAFVEDLGRRELGRRAYRLIKRARDHDVILSNKNVRDRLINAFYKKYMKNSKPYLALIKMRKQLRGTMASAIRRLRENTTTIKNNPAFDSDMFKKYVGSYRRVKKSYDIANSYRVRISANFTSPVRILKHWIDKISRSTNQDRANAKKVIHAIKNSGFRGGVKSALMQYYSLSIRQQPARRTPPPIRVSKIIFSVFGSAKLRPKKQTSGDFRLDGNDPKKWVDKLLSGVRILSLTDVQWSYVVNKFDEWKKQSNIMDRNRFNASIRSLRSVRDTFFKLNLVGNYVALTSHLNALFEVRDLLIKVLLSGSTQHQKIFIQQAIKKATVGIRKFNSMYDRKITEALTEINRIGSSITKARAFTKPNSVTALRVKKLLYYTTVLKRKADYGKFKMELPSSVETLRKKWNALIKQADKPITITVNDVSLTRQINLEKYIQRLGVRRKDVVRIRLLRLAPNQSGLSFFLAKESLEFGKMIKIKIRKISGGRMPTNQEINRYLNPKFTQRHTGAGKGYKLVAKYSIRFFRRHIKASISFKSEYDYGQEALKQKIRKDFRSILKYIPHHASGTLHYKGTYNFR